MKMKKWLRILIIFMLLFSVAPSFSSGYAQNGEDEITREDLFVPGEIIVRVQGEEVEAGVSAQTEALASMVGAQIVEVYREMVLLSLSPDADVKALSAQLAGEEGVLSAEPNYISWIPEEDPLADGDPYELTEITRQTPGGEEYTITVEELLAMRTEGKKATYPNDGFNNWGWERTASDVIWPDKAKAPDVCVIDTGVDDKHPDLKGRVQMNKGYDFVNADKKAYDDYGHGTHVAGVIVAKAGNGEGLAGIASEQTNVIPVKVLSAQGWGTAYDIAQGIYHCADQKSVGVLNMSLGGTSPSLTEYAALDYAINYRDKLLVAAAGNSWVNTNAYPHYPSGWADPALWPNGTDYDGGGALDYIHYSTIAVGASVPWGTWVDTDGDGVDDGWSEWFYNCAAYFSNYGPYVEIVAPGIDIYSTVPVSYPFYAQYYYGADWDEDGYDWWGGTSMATPHVAAGAARAWSVGPGWITDPAKRAARSWNSWDIKSHLIATGDPLELATDPNTVDPDDAYWMGGYSGDGPFCWPDDTAPFSADQDMGGSVFLNVSAAMDRARIVGTTYDSVTGLPLRGADMLAKSTSSGAKGKAYLDSDWTARWEIINLPAGETYNVAVSKGGYAKNQVVGQVIPPFPLPGGWSWTSDEIWAVGVPPQRNDIQVVMDWTWYGTGDDLDMFLWLPLGSPSGIVGSGGLEFWYGHPNDLGPGTLLAYPYARWNRDGGWSDWYSSETITIKAGKTPYYNGTYEVAVFDYGAGILGWDEPTIRVWQKGKIRLQYTMGEVGGALCALGDDWWHVLIINGTNIIPTDVCGSTGLLPYVEAGSVQTIPGQPLKNPPSTSDQ